MVKESTGSKGRELRAIRDEKGLSRQRAVEFFGRHGYEFSTKSLQNWESGERKPRDVDLDDLIELLEGYQKRAGSKKEKEGDAVLSGSGKPRNGDDFRSVRGTATEYRFFGRNFGAEEEPVPEVADEVVVVSDRIIRAELGRLPDPDLTYWTCVNGESMEPFLRDGAPILVEEIEGGIVAPGRYVLHLNSAGGIVKRCERLGEDTLRVASDNRSFSTQVLTRQDCGLYKDRNGHSVQLRVQGRVIYPRDTPRAIKEQTIGDVARAIGEATG